MSLEKGNQGSEPAPRTRGWGSVRALVFGAALLVGGFVWASHLLQDHDPPHFKHNYGPQVFLVVWPPRGSVDFLTLLGITRFDVDVKETPNGCQNPVHVEVDLRLGQAQRIVPADYRNFQGAVTGEIYDPTLSAQHFVEGEMTKATWLSRFQLRGGDTFKARATETVASMPYFTPVSGPALIEQSWVGDQEKSFETPLDTWFPQASQLGGVTVFGLHAMRITFDANWEWAKSHDTCYIAVPNVATYSPSYLHIGQHLTPGTGAVTLDQVHSSSVNTASSLPPPTNPRGPTWNCSIVVPPHGAPSGCGGFAVLQEANSNQHTQTWLLIAGSLIGAGFALIAEALVNWRWPPGLKLPAEGDWPDNDGLFGA